MNKYFPKEERNTSVNKISKKMISKQKSMCLFFILFLLPTCSSIKSHKFGDIKQKGDTIEGTGTIRYLEIEGGFYGIETSEEHYDAINLPAEFRKDGLRIRFKAKLRKDLMSFHMWGSLVELVYIKKLHKEEISKFDVREIKSLFGKRYLYFCSNCLKVLGLSHRKGFFMG